MEYLGISLSSSSDVSGGVFYPEYFSNQFFLYDLTNKGPITAIRIEGATSSIEKRLENLKKELGLLDDEINYLDDEQSKIFWKFTQNLKAFEKSGKNLIKVVIPPSKAVQTINNLKKLLTRYFIDWGGNLIWMEIDKLNSEILREIEEVIDNVGGYYIIVKLDDGKQVLTCLK